jgi:acetyltransferase-like isoleucine patch superfamily enzyme
MACFRVDRFFSTLGSCASLVWQGCSPGRGFRTSGHCWFKARYPGAIRIGRNVTLLSSHRSNRVGLTQPVMLQTLGAGVIEIGDYSGASGLAVSARSSVRIGRHVKLGGNVRIYDHDFHSIDADIRSSLTDAQHVASKPVVIGDHVFIGVNAIILKGVNIGDKAIIGAGAVVTRSIPGGEVWGGNPACKIR